MKKKEERWEESVFLIKRLGEEEMTAEHRKPSTHTLSTHYKLSSPVSSCRKERLPTKNPFGSRTRYYAPGRPR